MPNLVCDFLYGCFVLLSLFTFPSILTKGFVFLAIPKMYLTLSYSTVLPVKRRELNTHTHTLPYNWSVKDAVVHWALHSAALLSPPIIMFLTLQHTQMLLEMLLAPPLWALLYRSLKIKKIRALINTSQSMAVKVPLKLHRLQMENYA